MSYLGILKQRLKADVYLYPIPLEKLKIELNFV